MNARLTDHAAEARGPFVARADRERENIEISRAVEPLCEIPLRLGRKVVLRTEPLVLEHGGRIR
jgi:hypothetical protein